MDGLFKYIEAEALDRLSSPSGAVVTQVIVLVEVEHARETQGASRLSLSRHHSGRGLREQEEAGLIVKRLGDIL